jgi:hypothetical protein
MCQERRLSPKVWIKACTRVPMTYDFPEIIITGRGSVVRQWSNKFLGLSVVFTYTDIGKAENLTVNNNKWRIRTFFGWRL